MAIGINQAPSASLPSFCDANHRRVCVVCETTLLATALVLLLRFLGRRNKAVLAFETHFGLLGIDTGGS